MAVRLGTHYSYGQSPTALMQVAALMAKDIANDAAARQSTPVLAYMGMSGISIATAIALYFTSVYPDLVFYMIYVRKESEQDDCHGQRVEFNFTQDSCPDADHCNAFIAFVDDLVCTGGTREAVKEGIMKQAGATYCPMMRMMSGAITYTYTTDRYKLDD